METKAVRPRQIYYIAPKAMMSGEPYVGVGREQRRAPGDNSLRSRPRTEGTAVGPYAFGYTVIKVAPDDLAGVVDAIRKGAVGGRGIVERGVGAAAVEEAVCAAGVVVLPDDLARVVDAVCIGAAGEGIVEGGVGIDWHDTGSLM
jgi:hypothetical protein